MAAKKKAYEQKAVTTRISITSRASVKVRDNFYTLEYQEERTIPDIAGVDLEQEKKLLWDTCNAEVDKQIEDVFSLMGKK